MAGPSFHVPLKLAVYVLVDWGLENKIKVTTDIFQLHLLRFSQH